MQVCQYIYILKEPVLLLFTRGANNCGEDSTLIKPRFVLWCKCCYERYTVVCYVCKTVLISAVLVTYLEWNADVAERACVHIYA